jgi:hypothetical protein
VPREEDERQLPLTNRPAMELRGPARAYAGGASHLHGRAVSSLLGLVHQAKHGGRRYDVTLQMIGKYG